MLKTGKSKAVLSENIKTEREAGKPEKQAIAIAFAERRRSHTHHKRHPRGV